VTTFNTQPQLQQQQPSQPTAKFIDFTFFQPALQRFVLGQSIDQKSPRQHQTEYLSLNSLEERSINPLDSYHSYETLNDDRASSISTFNTQLNKRSSPKSVVPVFNNDLEDSNDIYSNDAYEDDDVIVIPFTRQGGQAFKDGKPYTGKNEEGVPKGPLPIESSDSNNKIKKKFASKVITDSDDDLSTGDDELPASLSDNEKSDFKVQFSDLHPVYVRPPKEFQPIFYPNREIDGSKLVINRNDAIVQPLVTDKNQEIPYKYPNGISSWMLGGFRYGIKGGYWENLLKDESLYGYNNVKKPIENVNSNNLDNLEFSYNNNNNNDKLEIISLSEPQNTATDNGSFDDLVDLKKEKIIKKPILMKKTSLLSSSSSKDNLVRRKLVNLRPKKVKLFPSSETNAKKLN